MSIHKDLYIEAEIGKDISQQEADEILHELTDDNGDVDSVLKKVLKLANDTHNNGATVIDEYYPEFNAEIEEKDDKLF
jgi:hypothetical protein